MKKKHQPGCPCCLTAVPCFCTNDAWNDFQITLAGFTDDAIPGLAAVINGTHLISRTVSIATICSGSIEIPHDVLWPTQFASCPQCDEIGDGTIKIEASIKPRGVVVPGGPSTFIGLQLRVYLSIGGRDVTCYGQTFERYYEHWSWQQDIGIVDCLDIDEDLPLYSSALLPSFYPACAGVYNVNGFSASCNYQLAV